MKAPLTATPVAAAPETLRADVIVVGGGLVGASAAFFLRRRGLSVILLERGLVGQQASGTNFGNVRRQGRALAQLPLAARARDIWGRLPELLGEDAEFLDSGHLRVCYSEEQAEDFARYAVDARPYGLNLEVMGAAELRRRYGLFGPAVLAGSLSAVDGHANPRLAGPAFGRGARRAGATVLEHTEVLRVEREGGDFLVHTQAHPAGGEGPRCRAPQLLVATGAWGNRIASAFGEPVPIVAHGPQMGVTEPLPYAIGPAIGVTTKNVAEGMYFRQVKRGNIVFGGGPKGPAYADRLRAYVEPANTLNQLQQLRRLAPALGGLQLIRTWSGIEGYLQDSKPVLGPSARVDGLYYAFGFCGEGFAIGPGIGDSMAELIATGQTSTPYPDSHIGRFAAAEAAACA